MLEDKNNRSLALCNFLFVFIFQAYVDIYNAIELLPLRCQGVGCAITNGKI
jgi:hypothetical protein